MGANTYRGVTGYLGESFKDSDMGMDYAFFSTSTNPQVAKDFTKNLDEGIEKTVLFNVDYSPTCRGVDIRLLSIFPGEEEVLFPPCTGLVLVDYENFTSTGTIQVRPE